MERKYRMTISLKLRAHLQISKALHRTPYEGRGGAKNPERYLSLKKTSSQRNPEFFSI